MFYEISKIQLIGASRLRVMAISLSRVIQFLPQNYFGGYIYIVETKTLSSCDVLNPLIINNDNIFALISQCLRQHKPAS